MFGVISQRWNYWRIILWIFVNFSCSLMGVSHGVNYNQMGKGMVTMCIAFLEWHTQLWRNFDMDCQSLSGDQSYSQILINERWSELWLYGLLRKRFALGESNVIGWSWVDLKGPRPKIKSLFIITFFFSQEPRPYPKAKATWFENFKTLTQTPLLWWGVNGSLTDLSNFRILFTVN